MWYVIPPILIRGHPFALWPFSTIWQWNIPPTTSVGMSNWCISEQVLAKWWHPVASSEALDLLYQTMRVVLYRRIAMAIKTASKVGVLFDCCFVDCCPGGRRGNTGQVVARWRLPGASILAVDLLHQAMPCALLQCIHMAIFNGLQRRHICLSLLILSSTITVAKQHSNTYFKLTASYIIDHYYVIN